MNHQYMYSDTPHNPITFEQMLEALNQPIYNINPIEKEMRKVWSLLFLILFLNAQVSETVNVLKLGTHLPPQKLYSDSLIQIHITESFRFSTDHNFHSTDSQHISGQLKEQADYFVLKVTGKYKTKTYQKLLRNYEKLVQILLQKLIIGDERMLIKSKIKQKYYRKKHRWEFGIMFVVMEENREMEECLQRHLKNLGVTRISADLVKRQYTKIHEPTDVQYDKLYNPRLTILYSFFKIKQKVKAEISKIPKMEIVELVEFETKGLYLNGSEDILESSNLNSRISHKFEKIPGNEVQSGSSITSSQELAHPFYEFLFLQQQTSSFAETFSIRAVFRTGFNEESSQGSHYSDSEQQSSYSEYRSSSSRSESSSKDE